MTTKINKKTGSRECEKYQLDLTDYVRGDMTFLTKQKQHRLFEHLRKCASCRQEFFDWEETFGVLVTEHHHARPETKKKMNALIERLKKESLPTPVKPIRGKKLDPETEIGTVAGVVWRILGKNGEISLKNLLRKTKVHPHKINQAVGWLAKENKVVMRKDDKDTYVYLNERERQIYQQE